jgi:hypothetical protein
VALDGVLADGVEGRRKVNGMGNGTLLGYLLKKWKQGKVISEKEFPPTAKGLRAAERLKRTAKQDKPGRPGQAVTITPIYGRAEA